MNLRVSAFLPVLLVLLTSLVSADNISIQDCNRLPLPSWNSGACATLNETECNNYYQWSINFGFWFYNPWFYNQSTYNCFWNGTNCSMNDTNECNHGQYNVSVFSTTTTLCNMKITLKQPGISICNNDVCDDYFCMDGTQDYFLIWKYSGLIESYGKHSFWSIAYTGVIFFITITIVLFCIIILVLSVLYVVSNLLRGNQIT